MEIRSRSCGAPSSSSAESTFPLSLVTSELKRRLRPAEISEADFKALQEAYDRYLKTISPGQAAREQLESFITKTEAVTSAAKTLDTLKKGMDAGAAEARQAAQRIPDLENALRAAEAAARQAKEGTNQAYQGAM